MTSIEVARALGVSDRRIYQLDAALEPVVETLPSGRKRRRYYPDRVLAVAARRERIAIARCS